MHDPIISLVTSYVLIAKNQSFVENRIRKSENGLHCSSLLVVLVLVVFTGIHTSFDVLLTITMHASYRTLQGIPVVRKSPTDRLYLWLCTRQYKIHHHRRRYLRRQRWQRDHRGKKNDSFEIRIRRWVCIVDQQITVPSRHECEYLCVVLFGGSLRHLRFDLWELSTEFFFFDVTNYWQGLLFHRSAGARP